MSNLSVSISRNSTNAPPTAAERAAKSSATSTFASSMLASTVKSANAVRLTDNFNSGQAVIARAIAASGKQKMSGHAAARAASGFMVAMGGTGMRRKSPAQSSSQEEAESGDVMSVMEMTRELQELNMRFNLQYLQLQHAMESENRQFTTLSNVMKTKHDSAKSAIDNIKSG
ncbi:MAG: hypothetical protein AAFU77_11235 [Myxococcota bacterium]